MPDESTRDFFIGYLPDAPPALARWLRPRVILLVLGTAFLGALIAASQKPFSKAAFEYGTERSFEGRLELRPYPMLLVPRPGASGYSRYLLTTSGKHGATDAVRGYDGLRVELRGTLVYRDDQTMIEIADGSIEELTDGERLAVSIDQDLGEHTLVGEIVDSKCFLGVMKPGNTKPHRACATRCISGGVPPVLLVRDAEGRADYFLLVSEAGDPVGENVLDLVAEPVAITGRIRRMDDLFVLYADPEGYQRLHD